MMDDESLRHIHSRELLHSFSETRWYQPNQSKAFETGKQAAFENGVRHHFHALTPTNQKRFNKLNNTVPQLTIITRNLESTITACFIDCQGWNGASINRKNAVSRARLLLFRRTSLLTQCCSVSAADPSRSLEVDG
jgi:hypothetical protein